MALWMDFWTPSFSWNLAAAAGALISHTCHTSHTCDTCQDSHVSSPDLRVAHDHRPDLALAVPHRSPRTGPPEVENILHKTDSYYILYMNLFC